VRRFNQVRLADYLPPITISASVMRGLRGAYRRSRVGDGLSAAGAHLYAVTNFNVFGSVSHQGQTRLYFGQLIPQWPPSRICCDLYPRLARTLYAMGNRAGGRSSSNEITYVDSGSQHPVAIP